MIVNRGKQMGMDFQEEIDALKGVDWEREMAAVQDPSVQVRRLAAASRLGKCRKCGCLRPLCDLIATRGCACLMPAQPFGARLVANISISALLSWRWCSCPPPLPNNLPNAVPVLLHRALPRLPRRQSGVGACNGNDSGGQEVRALGHRGG